MIQVRFLLEALMSKKDKEKKSKREFSAGGVVYKKGKGGMRWLVCKHSGYHKWVFPKGLVEEGEKAKETALREVEEECGIKTKIILKIPEPEKYIYTFEGTKIFKLVEYFLMEYISGDIKDHDWEMEEVEWLKFDKARERLDFSAAKKVLDKAKKRLEDKEKQLKLV